MSKKWHQLTDREVLTSLKAKKYTTCEFEGKVFNHKGLQRKPFHGKNTPHLFVVVFCNGNQRRGIAVSRLVWMDKLKRTIPKGWEIHHRDEDPTNNSFENLLCLHPADHLKLHRNDQEDDTPF